MKTPLFLLLVTSLLISGWAHGAPPIKVDELDQEIVGTLVINADGSYSLKADENADPVALVPGNSAIASQLVSLQNQDFLRGSGINNGNSLEIDSLEFVGIHRLLGAWSAGRGHLDFLNFSDLRVASLDSKDAARKYALSPVNNGVFKLFIATSQSVDLYSLCFSDHNHTISLQPEDPSKSPIVFRRSQ